MSTELSIAMVTEDVATMDEISESATEGEVPVPAIGEVPVPSDSPVVVTLAPPKTSGMYDKRLTPDEVEQLKAALSSCSVSRMAQAIRSIRVLSYEIKKQNNQVLTAARNKQNKKRSSGPVNSSQGVGESGEGGQVIKKRAPRTQPAERRRPWKPERLDNSKPILQCDACGYQANRRDYMRRHQIRVHSDYRPYQCTLCEFKTTEKHDLDRHMNSKYHGGKGLSQKRQKMTATVRIKCDQCNYSSKSVTSILKHKQIHALERQQEQELYEEEGEEPMDGEDQVGHVSAEPASIQGNTDDLEDPVTVIMMNDLVAQTE